MLLNDGQWEQMRAVADRDGGSIADHVRRMIEVYAPLQCSFLSGASVIGIEAHTTSGSVWLRGF